MKIVVLEALRIGRDISFSCLKDFGEVVVYDETATPALASERIKDADIIVVDQLQCNAESLEGAHRLKLITMTSTGTDFVDFNYTGSRNIKVLNIKNYSTDSVAQHTFGMLLYLWEKSAHFDSYVKSEKYVNDFENSALLATFHELAGKTWGIAGLGNIGRRVAEIASAFGCNIVYYSPSGRNYDVPYKQVNFSTLLARSDILSVHTPLTGNTKLMFNYDAFCQMKADSYFINMARGGLVDEAGLVRALNENKIAAAGLDVLTREPMSPDCPLKSIKDSSRLFITPHIGWASVESRQRAVQQIYKNIAAFLEK